MMKHATVNKACMRRHHLKLQTAGLCTHCGKVPARANRQTCAACGAKNSQSSAARIHRLRPINSRLGICTVCNARESMPGRKWCGVCSESNTEKQARNRAKRKALGLCPRCGKASAPGRVMCATHLKRMPEVAA